MVLLNENNLTWARLVAYTDGDVLLLNTKEITGAIVGVGGFPIWYTNERIDKINANRISRMGETRRGFRKNFWPTWEKNMIDIPNDADLAEYFKTA